jgi:hypothetical protein
LIVNTGLEIIYGSFTGASSMISHIAIGDATTPVLLSDSRLGNERFRKPITNIILEGSSILVEAFIDKEEANFSWGEIGLYSNGLDSTNTGLLLARALLKEDKDNLRTTNILWEIQFQRG